ncbi:MAG: hypothetical protein JWM11_2199, partial [Planctomycetaceae bacterium]|nr:hypothetical protein [Planctomycetaceae bacterium]
MLISTIDRLLTSVWQCDSSWSRRLVRNQEPRRRNCPIDSRLERVGVLDQIVNSFRRLLVSNIRNAPHRRAGTHLISAAAELGRFPAIVETLEGRVLLSGVALLEVSYSESPLNQNDPLNVILISNAVQQANQVAVAAASGTIVITYDSRITDTIGLISILDSVVAQHGNQQIGHLAIVTHGAAGIVEIGAGEVWDTSDLASSAPEFSHLRELLTPHARFDLYACSVAAGIEGKSFVDSLAIATGADVFASDNIVGSGEAGDFVWEYDSSTICNSGSDLLSRELLESIRGLSLDDFNTPIGSFNNVEAKSNGTPLNNSHTYNTDMDVTTGLEWQCVEYVNRYYFEHYGIDLLSLGSLNADSFYSASLGLNRYANGSNTQPQVGDILCFGGGDFGHVAIIREVTPTQIFVIQQNVTENSRDANFAYNMSVSGGNYSVSASTLGPGFFVQGWLRNPSPTFKVGDGISATEDGLTVRSSAGGAQIGVESKGTTGIVIGGPQSVAFNQVLRTWWMVQWNDGVTGWSAEINVAHSNSLIAAPTLIGAGTNSFPGQTLSNTKPVFQWRSVPTADQYRLSIRQLDASGVAGNLVFDSIAQGFVISGAATQFANVLSSYLQNGGYYRWSMQSHDSDGWSVGAPALWFTVNTSPVSSAPEVAVTGNGQDIADGDTTPGTTNWTDFGNVPQGGTPIRRTFTVSNTGNATLNLSNLIVPAGFSVIDGLVNSLAAGSSDTITVVIDTSSSATKSGQVTFTTNDSNENPFNFSITGTVTAATAPDVSVEGNGIEISNGDSSPSTPDGTDFGLVTKGAGTISRSFIVYNKGTASLVLSNFTFPDGFTVTDSLVNSISPGGSDTITIRLDTSSTGTKSGHINFTTNDSDENPFNFSISGLVAVADLKLDLVDGPTSGLAGSDIDVLTDVRNLGNVASDGYTVNYYLSTDPNITSADLPLTPANKTSIAAHENEPWSESIVIPAAVASGKYWLGAIVVSSNPQNESDTSNQVFVDSQPIQIGVSTPGDAGFIFPVGDPYLGATVIHQFGEGTGPLLGNLGTDFAGAIGTPVVAAADGEVTFSQYAGPTWGNVVIIEHLATHWGWTKDVFTLYAHIDSRVSVGQQVSRGQQIATIGSAVVGSTGPNLHFEFRSGTDAGTITGPGFYGALFDRSQKSSVELSGFSTTWFDPFLKVATNPYHAPASLHPIDLKPTEITGPGSVVIGSSIDVNSRVLNDWPTNSGNFDVSFRLSTDNTIDENDIELYRESRQGISSTSDGSWPRSMLIKSNIPAGTYYLGLIVYPPSGITETQAGNNSLASKSPIIIRSTNIPQADLVGQGLQIQPVNGQFGWGLPFTATYSVRNVGTVTETHNTIVSFELVDNPQSPSWTVQLGTMPLASLAAGNSGGNHVELHLPTTAPAGYLGGPVVVRMIVDSTNADPSEIDETNNRGQGEGLDFATIPGNQFQPTGPADLVGTQLTLNPDLYHYEWGQSFAINYTFKNQGGTAAGPFTYKFYLSTDANFDESDKEIGSRTLFSLSPGQFHTESVQVTLPNSPPAGFTSGTLYIGAVLDTTNHVPENKNNNRRVGQGIDFTSLIIVPPPPVSNVAEPVISNFSVDPASFLKGQRITLSATNVLDDNHAANEVVFKLDANGDGNWDDSDPLIAYGSKDIDLQTSEVNFTASVLTTNWPVGPVVIMARATDNFGLHSTISKVTVNVLGLETGPFNDDSYENNNTPETAWFLGGKQDYSLQNLALEPGDSDNYAFEVIGDATSIQVDLNFFQDLDQGAGQPTGNLTLELRRIGSQQSYGFSNTSIPGDGLTTPPTTNTVGHEKILLQTPVGGTLTEGRYVIIVGGVTPVEQNRKYSLKIQIAGFNGAPTGGNFSVSQDTIVQGEPITLSMSGITGVPANEIDGVSFYADFNNNGAIDFDSEYLGSDFGPGGESVGGVHSLTVSTGNWNLGENRVLVLVTRLNGPTSLAQIAQVVVSPNMPPAAGSLAAPDTAIQGGTVTLTSNNIGDPDGRVGRVSFGLDIDNNGVWDLNDLVLGDGSISGDTATAVFPTANWPLGTARVFAQSFDDLGLAGDIVSTTLAIVASDNVRPVIGSFSGPDFVTRGNPLTLTANDVSDPNGDTLNVSFWMDANLDGALDAGDLLLGGGIQNVNQWSLTLSTAGFAQGTSFFFAQVTDSGVPQFSSDAQLSVTVIDTTGPRVISQTPAATVEGSFDSIQVQFSEPIDLSTFTLADVLLTGPSGVITVSSVVSLSSTVFEIHFARQTNVGTYSAAIGPGISDVAGNLMDQDQDGQQGESTEDVDTATVNLTQTLVQFGWAGGITATGGNVFVNSSTEDSAGNIYVVGQFVGAVDFDPGTGTVSRTTTGGDRNMFIAKYSAAGAVMWVTTYGGTLGEENARDVAVDSSGNVYVTGEFGGTVVFSGNSRTSAGNLDIVALKLNNSGNLVWVQTIGGTSSEFGQGIAVDNSGNLYVAGTFQGTVNFGGTNKSAISLDGFLLKLSTSNGSVTWVQQFGGSNDESATHVAIDNSGNVYTTGSFKGTTDFNKGGTPQTRTSNNNS